MNHNELKKINPQWIRDTNGCRYPGSVTRISKFRALRDRPPTPSPWIEMDWAHPEVTCVSPKIVGPPCAWNRNPWKSQTMSIWFGLTCFFLEKNLTKSAAFICRVCWHTQALIKKLPHFTPGRKNPQSKRQTHTTWCGFRIWNLQDIRANTSELEHMDRGITKLHKKKQENCDLYLDHPKSKLQKYKN